MVSQKPQKRQFFVNNLLLEAYFFRDKRGLIIFRKIKPIEFLFCTLK